jgi:hypothetical protein
MRALSMLLIGWALAAGSVQAQAPAPAARALQPLTAAAIAPALERPVGQAVQGARTGGKIDLKGRTVYLAEYVLFFDAGGETTVGSDEAALLGRRIATQGSENVLLAWRAQPDIEALQRLTDRAYQDLQARLKAAGVTLAEPEAVTFLHGTIYAATEAGSRPGAPNLFEHRVGDTLRRYLAFVPSGMRMIPRGLTGIGLGNLPARVNYLARNAESLSLAIAVNFSGLEGAPRPSPFTTPDDDLTLAPLMEIVPAPSAALVNAHAQLALVNLTEPIVVEGDFARLRLNKGKDANVQAPESALDSLRTIGRRILSGQSPRREGPRIETLLEFDGPTTARFALVGLSAANQAIADALLAAQQP